MKSIQNQLKSVKTQKIGPNQPHRPPLRKSQRTFAHSPPARQHEEGHRPGELEGRAQERQEQQPKGHRLHHQGRRALLPKVSPSGAGLCS